MDIGIEEIDYPNYANCQIDEKNDMTLLDVPILEYKCPGHKLKV